MSEKDFTITLYQDKLSQFKLNNESSVIKPAAKNLFYFPFDAEPNIEEGDVINVKIVIDKYSQVEFKATIEDKVPPLKLPANEAAFENHAPVLDKYFAQDVIDKIRNDYFAGVGYKDAWSIYFKKLEE